MCWKTVLLLGAKVSIITLLITACMSDIKTYPKTGQMEKQILCWKQRLCSKSSKFAQLDKHVYLIIYTNWLQLTILVVDVFIYNFEFKTQHLKCTYKDIYKSCQYPRIKWGIFFYLISKNLGGVLECTSFFSLKNLKEI